MKSGKKIESKLPGLKIDLGQIIEDMIGDLISSKQPIEIKIFGDDQSTLENIANQVADIIDQTTGTADVFNGITIAGPSIIFNPNNESLAQYGLTPNDLQFQMNSKIKGEVVGDILGQNQLFNIRMYRWKTL